MTNYIIEIFDENNYEYDTNSLEQAVIAVLETHQVAATTLSIALVDNAAIQSLNMQHRGVNAPTDVLSFAADFPLELGEDEQYLGDLVIAYPYTKSQAEQEGFTLHDSLILMVIHGTLHLLGYDHDTPENRERMWAAQTDILNKLGVNPAIVPAYEGMDDA